MLYMVLFSTLAVGFAGATAMNAQISRNERYLQQADSAADGGMQFIRYQLGAMTIPPATPTSGLLSAAATSLGTLLNGTSNMGGHTVQVTNGAIYIPSATSWTTIDPTVGTRFRAMIFQSGQFLIAVVDGAGSNSNIEKALQMQFQLAPKAGAILDYGVATEGTLKTSGATVIQGLTDPTKGSVLSADMTSSTPVMIGGQSVSGDISIVNPSANISVGSSTSVGGTNNPALMVQHEHVGVPAPTFPTVDTSVFTAYATNAYTGNGICNNCYIPPNTNPKFSGGQINGVMWIQAPNQVTFVGNTAITGVIVTDTGASAPAFNSNTNTISFGGTVSATPISQMTTSNPAYSASLAQLTGSFMLAPNFAVSMTGNFGTIGGSMVVGNLSMSGNASGVVQGSVIGMQPGVGMSLGGTSSIAISSTGTSNYPTGMSFGNDYTPLPGTYIEVQPW